MKEEIVKKVFKTYFESHFGEMEMKSKSAPGPDFEKEGKAYECKGSEFDWKRLFSQIISYAPRYSQLNIVLPYDSLNFLFLWQLEALEQFLRKKEYPSLGISVPVYLIAEKKEEYAIANWSSARMLNLEINKILYKLNSQFVQLSLEKKKKKILEFLENIEEEVKKEFKNRIIEKAQEAQYSQKFYDGDLIKINV
jgi:predicted RND superfamily exporter protein